MQRPCSTAILAEAASRSKISTCVEIRQGFKSPILHLKPLARDHKWLYLLVGRQPIQREFDGVGTRLTATGVESLNCVKSLLELVRQRSHVDRSTHLARHAGGSKGSAKYWVSCATLPESNSMMLTVWNGRPS
jgi:hypothetical protein